jgi:hypothetical protein
MHRYRVSSLHKLEDRCWINVIGRLHQHMDTIPNSGTRHKTILPHNNVWTIFITYIQYYAAVVDDFITFKQILHESVSANRILPGAFMFGRIHQRRRSASRFALMQKTRRWWVIGNSYYDKQWLRGARPDMCSSVWGSHVSVLCGIRDYVVRSSYRCVPHLITEVPCIYYHRSRTRTSWHALVSLAHFSMQLQM